MSGSFNPQPADEEQLADPTSDVFHGGSVFDGTSHPVDVVGHENESILVEGTGLRRLSGRGETIQSSGSSAQEHTPADPAGEPTLTTRSSQVYHRTAERGVITLQQSDAIIYDRDSRTQLDSSQGKEDATTSLTPQLSVGKEGCLSVASREKPWHLRNKHFFVVSSSGRPVFTRYGDENSFSDLFGILRVMVELGSSLTYTLRQAFSEDVQVVFHTVGEMTYVAVTRTQETYRSLVRQLHLIHQELLTIIPNIQTILRSRGTFDVRRFLSEGDDIVVRKLLTAMNYEPSFSFDVIPSLPVPRLLRVRVAQAIQRASKTSRELIFSVLMLRRHVIQVVSFKKYTLHPRDLLLLVHHVTTSPSMDEMAQTETWLPLSLPHFAPEAFVWVYVNFLDHGLILVQVASDQEHFDAMSAVCNRVVETFQRDAILAELKKALSTSCRGVEEVQRDAEMAIPPTRNASGLAHTWWTMSGTLEVAMFGIPFVHQVLYIIPGQYVASRLRLLAMPRTDPSEQERPPPAILEPLLRKRWKMILRKYVWLSEHTQLLPTAEAQHNVTSGRTQPEAKSSPMEDIHALIFANARANSMSSDNRTSLDSSVRETTGASSIDASSPRSSKDHYMELRTDDAVYVTYHTHGNQLYVTFQPLTSAAVIHDCLTRLLIYFVKNHSDLFM